MRLIHAKMSVLKKIALVILCLGLLGNSRPIIVLTAPPGHYEFHEFGEKAARYTVSAKIKIIEFDPSDEWPPAAYFGFYDAEDRTNSVHFLLIKMDDAGKYAIAGYRVIESGEEAKSRSVVDIDIDKEANVTMKFDNGIATLKINCKDPIRIPTKLKTVVPAVSVSSGKAYFNITSEKVGLAE